MKVGVYCESPLLQKSLEIYLKDHLVSPKQAEVIITDKRVKSSKPTLWISSHEDANIKKPFSRSRLFLALESFYKQKKEYRVLKNLLDHHKSVESFKEASLEEKLQEIIERFSAEIISTVKEYYEKR